MAPPRDLGIVIAEVDIRHSAKYKSRASNSSLLTITMTRHLINEIDYRKDRSIIRFTSYSAAARGQVHGQVNKPDEWFEAHLSSWRAEDMFRENAEMEVPKVSQASMRTHVYRFPGLSSRLYRWYSAG